MRYRDDAFRFLNGTPAIPGLYAAQEGPKIIAEVGIEKIRKKSVRQTTQLIEEALRRGYDVNTPLDPERRGGTVTLNVPHGYEVSRELLSREILVDYREGAGIRLAPHFYNSDEEVVYAVREIEKILNAKSYQRHSKRKASVT
jgi:kynureninase